MATNTKMLELTFNVEGGRSMILSIPSPKEDLTLATVKEKAALIIPCWSLPPALPSLR